MRRFVLVALTTAGVLAMATDAQAFGRRKKKGCSGGTAYAAPVYAAPAGGCCGGGYAAVPGYGASGYAAGSVVGGPMYATMPATTSQPMVMPAGAYTTGVPGQVVPAGYPATGYYPPAGSVYPAGGAVYPGGVAPGGVYIPPTPMPSGTIPGTGGLSGIPGTGTNR